MGYGAMAWAVDLDRLRAEIGGGNPEAAQRHGAGFAARHAGMQSDIDDMTGAPGSVTLADVARHMIMGEPCDERIGFAYGYFLEYLCDVRGTFLDNSHWMPVPVDFGSRLDDVLAEAGVLADGFRVTDLLFGGAPVKLPRIDDFPGIGYREFGALDEPAAGLARLGALDLPDEYMNPAYEVFQWLSHAQSTRRSVVAFFH
jgi:hypothetical protein